MDRTIWPVVVDYFNDNSLKWTEPNDSSNVYSVGNGVYSMNHLSKDLNGSFKNYDIYNGRDFSIETSIMWMLGIDNNGYGIIFGRQDWNNYTSFEITANGNYSLKQTVSGQYIERTGWRACNAINLFGAYNKLTIYKVNDKLNLYINDCLVEQLDYILVVVVGQG